MSRWQSIVGLILTANAFTISEASAWYVSHADAERLCVGKANKQYKWAIPAPGVEKGSCVGATTLLAAKWVVARLCEGEVRSPPCDPKPELPRST